MSRFPGPIRWAAAGLAAAAAVVAVVLAAGGGAKPSSPLPTRAAGATAQGATVGAPAPDFAAPDVVSGRTLRLADMRGRRTLLFFSEGASCQACLVQIRDLEPVLTRAGVRLVSVSTDPPDVLAQTARQYGIRTAMLSDATRRMSTDYGMLGKGGMGHPDTDGHAFVLLDRRGTIRWARAYAQMYVPPKEILRELP